MIEEHHLALLCCPRCRGKLSTTEDATGLSCASCDASYPVIDGIPVLLAGEVDEISETVQEYYEAGWRKNADGVPRARLVHEDLSDRGQRYIVDNERRFVSIFEGGGNVFLDAGSGAQPRVEFGQAFDYHLCVDLSLQGLQEARQVVGDRGIFVCGSLLDLPIRDHSLAGAMASHCIYHIDKELQSRALSEISRVVSPRGVGLIFYSNPDSPERRTIRGLRAISALLRKLGLRKPADSSQKLLYYFAHPIPYMLNALREEHGESGVKAVPLRMLTKQLSKPLLNAPLVGGVASKGLHLLERALGSRPGAASYVAYVLRGGRGSAAQS
ncbi:MAG: hypothetical protein CL910_09365 [Deltaproteobacteria bacterium]|jgi:hypothetical protein|nr:hypothetical protein [Deltaproteobacteria bacterium]